MIRVLVCDDHSIVRQGLRQMLADTQDLALTAEVADGTQGIGAVRAAAAQGAAIDVVLLDIAMPGRDGLDMLKQLKDEYPKLPVLILSTYPDRQYAVRCLRLGAAGYLNKSADSEQIMAAIRKVALMKGVDPDDLLAAQAQMPMGMPGMPGQSAGMPALPGPVQAPPGLPGTMPAMTGGPAGPAMPPTATPNGGFPWTG